MLENELTKALDLARSAGETLLRHYNTGFVTEEKIGVDNFSEPVTIADKEASELIVGGLRSSFPMDGVLSEEEPDRADVRLSRARVWIVDPMDGTAGFVKGHGDFAVQIGLVEKDSPVLGVVYMPFFDLMTYAVKGEGAFMIAAGGNMQAMRVAEKMSFGEMCLAVSRNHLSPRMGRIIEHFGFKKIVNRGSVGLKVSLIAEKECDVYVHPSPRTKLWDTCAPQIILEEAGGRMTDLFGSEMTYDRVDLQNHDGILATNGVAHDAIVEHLKPLLAEFGRTPHRARPDKSGAAA